MADTRFELGLDYAQYLDSTDELAELRAAFFIEEPDLHHPPERLVVT